MSDPLNKQYCGSPDIAYLNIDEREKYLADKRVMVLTPWTVQNICYEIVKNYMLENSPQKEGYVFSQTYDLDETKSGIAIEIAYHYKDSVIQKRPAIYVSRGQGVYTFPTINQLIGINAKESEKARFAIITMPVNLSVVATNVGFAEQMAEYVFKIFFRYQEIIKKDFCLRQFKLLTIDPPMLYLESKDHFVVNITLQAVFDLGTVIKGDHLKIKTITHTVFTSCSEQPLEQQ
jgi:hypothetical protein